jgi:hypothetical protein
MNYPAAELRGIKMNFYLINSDAEHRGILLINKEKIIAQLPSEYGVHSNQMRQWFQT